ncbi:MAG TPA: C-type lectin domain-containing protein [Kofleriaceae bacterium]|nr:C-type lectin domain-containing protein [Kofleriaceae bacterium]
MGPSAAIRFACAALLLVGCADYLDLDPPLLAPDAAVDTRNDASTVTPPDAAGCPAAPAGCTLFQCSATSSCYYACSGTGSWSTAQSYCTQVGDLVTIQSQVEQDCVVAAAKPTSGSPVWIGAHQTPDASEPAQGWTWAAGTSFYTHWGSYQPDDFYGTEDCAELSGGGMWNDAACSYDRRFVCEVP